jgi:hypothetical protein
MMGGSTSRADASTTASTFSAATFFVGEAVGEVELVGDPVGEAVRAVVTVGMVKDFMSPTMIVEISESIVFKSSVLTGSTVMDLDRTEKKYLQRVVDWCVCVGYVNGKESHSVT